MQTKEPLEIGFMDVYNNYLPLMDLSYFICILPSQQDEEADIKYLQSNKMKR